MDSSKSCTHIGAQGLIRLGSMIYSNKVYITMSSGVCQAQTRIQEQRVLGSNQKCAALRFKHNVYSDLAWGSRVQSDSDTSTKCTRIRPNRDPNKG
jgi:hypothetical protein